MNTFQIELTEQQLVTMYFALIDWRRKREAWHNNNPQAGDQGEIEDIRTTLKKVEDLILPRSSHH